MKNRRTYGSPPYKIAVVHGGHIHFGKKTFMTHATKRPLLLFLSSLLLCISFLCLAAAPEIQGLLGQDLKGAQKLIRQINQGKKKQDRYSIPRLMSYTETPYRNECKALKGDIILIQNRSTRVEGVGYPGMVAEGKLMSKMENVYFYFTRPLAPDQAYKITADFFPFLRSEQKLKKETITPGEGNECTPGNGGIRYVSGGYQLELFYEDPGVLTKSRQPLVYEAYVSGK